MLYVLIAVIAVVLIYFFLTYYVAGTTIYLNCQPVPKDPKDYGMEFENIELKPADGVNIKGWLIPGSQDKLIVMTHVGGLTRYGSTVSYKNMTITRRNFSGSKIRSTASNRIPISMTGRSRCWTGSNAGYSGIQQGDGTLCDRTGAAAGSKHDYKRR
jgi:hypothetical protein